MFTFVWLRIVVVLTLTICYATRTNQDFADVNLPTNHLVRYFNTFPYLRDKCLDSQNCPYYDILKNDSAKSVCWGYETSCKPPNNFQTPQCLGDHTGWVQNKEAQLDTFFYQADFGYIRQQIDEMSVMCEPTYREDSSLECTKYLRFCRGRNLMINFTDLSKRHDLIRYNMNVLSQGQIGGHCRLHRKRLMNEMEHMGALQSWAPELRYFEEKDFRPITGNGKCDIVVEKPTYIMKIDANYNMYHHFCDFINLYASLFVNQSHPLAFDTDTQVLIWESYPYESPFAETLKAFTKNPIWNLDNVRGKVVCFKNLVLPLLPRMIFGLYYNTPIINGCEKSGLFRAFSEFITHRLQIPMHEKINSKIRITFLSRKTKYRQALNEDELIAEISGNRDYFVRRISFERGMSFSDQLQIIRNTDILIGMHGAGLTHLLFLPNWATIFELYNCEDPNCYKDLARLRGVSYITWKDKSKLQTKDEGSQQKGGAHAKFVNYEFDPKEFASLVANGAQLVRDHDEFKVHLKPSSQRDEL
ncbi:EGF domain-specific O-linked N-acetylglucosamine transferase [Episyrphus balteatus]|uniref:EGF domain-specific O-linked N-acetylglucosamine transferase n=1 Tax=Episyrphus balteatus TaxID=286459 RepID=UPI002485289E|nr:EGF domain-specific O-linked N-acetylglucosamine transferase [Episyrphus balteatus]